MTDNEKDLLNEENLTPKDVLPEDKPLTGEAASPAHEEVSAGPTPEELAQVAENQLAPEVNEVTESAQTPVVAVEADAVASAQADASEEAVKVVADNTAEGEHAKTVAEPDQAQSTEESVPEQNTTQQGPKVFYTNRSPEVKQKFDKGEVVERQTNWRRFEQDPEDYKHNYFPDYFYAGFWIRFWAFLVDLICIWAITGGTVGLVYRVLDIEQTGGFLSVYNLAALVIYLAYFTLLTKLNQGQTIGKMLFGIRVVSLTETELSWTTVIMRETVCRFILKTFPFVLGYLPAAFSRRKQHLGDFFCETSVVTLNVIKAFNKEIRV